MGKRIVALFLIFTMLMSLAVPAFAVESPDYEMALVGTESGGLIEFDLQLRGTKLGSTQSILIKVDARQLKIVTYPGNAVTVPNNSGLTTFSDEVNWESLYGGQPGFINSIGFIGKQDDANNILYLGIQPEFKAQVTTLSSKLTSVGKFKLALQDGVSVSDLNNKSVQVLTKAEVDAVGQSEAAVLTDGGGTNYTYAPVSSAIDENLKKPAVTYPNSDKAVATPLTGIDVTLDKTTLAVPTAGKTATATATAAPLPADANLPGDIAYSITPAYAGVSIAADGKITVQPSAAAGSVTVKAASASKGFSDTATLTLTKDAAVATTVTVNPTSKTVTLNKDGSAPAGFDATVKVVDQYGAEMTGQTPTVSGTPAGASWAANKITFTNALRAGSSTIKFAVGGKEASLALTVNKAAAPAAPTGLVGTKVSAIGANDGTITGVTTNMEYRKGTSGTYTACTGTTITGLSEGSYQVRLKETDFANASANATVTVGVPGQTDKPTVTVTASSTTIPDGGDVTLTANVTPATGTITYQWNKDGAPISGATNQTLTATEAGSYTCTVTRQADGETVSDPATSDPVKLTVKTVPVATVTKKATASQKTGTLKTQNLVTVDGAAWADVSSAVKATVYREVVAEDGTKTYEEVTGSLEVGTYYVDVAVTALATDDFKLDAVAGVGDAPTDATLNQFVKLTVTKASNGSIGGGSSSGGSDSIEYTVTYDAGKHGKLDGASTETVKRGETPSKVPTVVPDNGYKFVGWTRNDKAVNPAATQIKSSVTFVATYEAAVDVNRYIEGVSDTSFAPNANATRGQLAAMLARLSKGFDKNASYTSNAPDVAANAWYTDFVNFAIQEGIMNGYEDGTFRPTANITRGEFAAMLARYVGLSEIEGDRFGDMIGNWANGYVNALAQAGIVDGFEDGTFKGNDLLTRAQAVKMINIAINMKYDASANYAYRFDDVASSAWYYSYVMPAANLDVAPYQK